jgi:hypothetical protein
MGAKEGREVDVDGVEEGGEEETGLLGGAWRAEEGRQMGL